MTVVRGGAGRGAAVPHPGGDPAGQIVPEPADRLPRDVSVGPPACQRLRIGPESDVVQPFADQMHQWPDHDDEDRDGEQFAAVAVPELRGAGGGKRVDQPTGIPDQPDLDAGAQDGEHEAGHHNGSQRPEFVHEKRPDTGRWRT